MCEVVCYYMWLVPLDLRTTSMQEDCAHSGTLVGSVFEQIVRSTKRRQQVLQELW